MEAKKVVEGLHPLERGVLPVLKDGIVFTEVVSKSGLKEVEAMRALQWLENKKIATLKKDRVEVVSLDINGKKYLKEGLPEKKFLSKLTKDTTLDDFKKKAGLSDEEFNVCIGTLRKKAAIMILPGRKLKKTEQADRFLKEESLEEKFLSKLPLKVDELSPEEKFAYAELKKRKQIIKTDDEKTVTVHLTELGKDLIKLDLTEEFGDRLTAKMLKDGSWKKQKFRSYDVKINVPKIYGGKRHFVNQSIDYIKKIWLDLGFKEMTGNYVQTSFWDLDALFVPQDHPARDMQDTFYLGTQGKLPKDFTEKVKKTHENGGDTGSKGWGYKWSSEKAKENLLRTHTTVLSAQTISNLKKEDLPVKFFAVGRVFRNENLDWKHLFEFIQVEGIVIDPSANFRNLVGYLKEFFGKMGFPDVRIRPAHFPYTEPSAEVDVWHPVKKEWVELGGSGIFRPEVVKPLLGFECPVLAWGIGMERAISEYYDIKDIRELYKNDLKQLREIKVWMK